MSHGSGMFLRAIACDLLACLRFYSRLPLPVFAFEAEPHAMLDFARAIRILPLAGALIGLPAAVVLVGCADMGLSPQITAGLTLVASVLTTGAFHEDGLADTADGFGGGSTRERKLEIMRDSRIGSYGGVALGLSLLLRWAALVTLLASGALPAALAWIALAGASRTAALLPLVLLPPARQDGAAYAAARPQPLAYLMACAISAALLLAPIAGGLKPGLSLAALILLALGSLAVTALSKRQIGGQTGDVAGAAQQVCEIIGLIVFGLQL